ncbi:MAG: alpha/beta hydrolase domain-containing protein [Microthrixaceae bacterium]
MRGILPRAPWRSQTAPGARDRSDGPTTTAQHIELHGGSGISLMGSLDAPDLAAAGYEELELTVAGTASAWRSTTTTLPFDGRFRLERGPAADYRTRVVVRRPVAPANRSGTVVLEWLNVSSGADAAPGYGFLGPEIVRRGHVWVGLSAQKAGIETAPALVDVGGIDLRGLRQQDPDRYGDLHHPGDAWSFDILTAVARALRDPSGPAGPEITKVVAIGESQSAYMLTTYVNGVQPVERCIDAFLIHSRGGPAAPLDGPDGRVDLDAGRHDPPVRIRDDLDVPVLVLQTETDVLGHLDYLPARQEDAERFRLWEVAGTAHADRSLVGDFESVLGCPTPVNRGQQRFVVRAALRALDAWSDRVPTAPRLSVVERTDGRAAYELDDVGNVVGGVRTPCVDVAAEVLSGLAAPGANRVCLLFGQTGAVPVEDLRRRYASVDAYLTAYAAATDAAIAAGFVLSEDRDEVVADARRELITW